MIDAKAAGELEKRLDAQVKQWPNSIWISMEIEEVRKLIAALRLAANVGLTPCPDVAKTDVYAVLSTANAVRQKEWDPSDKITLSFRGNELAGEVGEACNIIKKLERERIGLRGTRATKDQLADELADVAICTDLIAMTAGIDLPTAIRAKFNATSEKYGLKTRIATDAARAKAGEGT